MRDEATKGQIFPRNRGYLELSIKRGGVPQWLDGLYRKTYSKMADLDSLFFQVALGNPCFVLSENIGSFALYPFWGYIVKSLQGGLHLWIKSC